MGRLRDAWDVLRGAAPEREKAAILSPSINETTGQTEWKAESLFLGGSQSPRRGDKEVLASYELNPGFHSVILKIALSTATIPMKLFAVKSSRTAKYVRDMQLQQASPAERAREKAAMKRTGELREIDSHPMLDMLAKPNAFMTGLEARFFSLANYLQVGEYLWTLERNPAGMPISFMPFPKPWYAMVRSSSGELAFRVNPPGQSFMVAATDCLWVRHINPANPYGRGVGTGAALADEVEASEGASKRVKNFFKQNAMPESVISFEDISEPAMAAAKVDWEARFKGVANAFKNLWTNKKIQIQRLDTSFKEMTLVELLRYYRDNEGQTYGLPPELRGILESSNRATIDAADYIFARHVQVPLLEVQRDNQQSRLAPQYDERLLVDYESPVPDDKEFKQKVFAAHPAAFRKNEVRALAGEEPLDGADGDEFMTPAAPALPAPALLAADPPWVKQFGAGRVNKDLKLTDIDAVLEALRPARLTERVTPSMENGLREWGQQALTQVGATLSFDMQNPLVRQLMDDSGKRIVGVTDTTRDQLRATMRAGVEAGEGIDAIARRVRETFDLADSSRSRTIARTEVLGTANGGNFAAWKMSGVVTSKRWVHNQSADPRPAHQALDGVEVEIDGRWSSNGHTASHPGGFGVAEEDINCRCGMRPVVGDPKVAKDAMSDDERAAFFAAFDKAADGWERDVQRALRAGFDDQRLDVLAALNRLAG